MTQINYDQKQAENLYNAYIALGAAFNEASNNMIQAFNAVSGMHWNSPACNGQRTSSSSTGGSGSSSSGPTFEELIRTIQDWNQAAQTAIEQINNNIQQQFSAVFDSDHIG